MPGDKADHDPGGAAGAATAMPWWMELLSNALLGSAGLAGAPANTGSASAGPLQAALQPVRLNLERAYGGLADAMGLAPLRTLHTAAQDMLFASLARKQAQSEYLQVVVSALSQGAQTLLARLSQASERGESVDTMLGLIRLWAASTDQAMHDAMQAPAALAVSAKLLRASATSRQQQQRVVAVLSEALNVPTRAEVDEAYREIQEIKRELRRLRKPAPSPEDPAVRPRAAKATLPRSPRKPKAAQS